MKIQPVQTRRQWLEFVKLPYKLYFQNQRWIPPLLSEQKKIFNPKTNSMLQHCDYQLFLLKREKKIIGRIAVFYDPASNQHWGDSIGLFGSYECIDDPAAASLLFQTAEDWLRAQKMTKMRGPWSFVSQDWGFIVEGFDLAPVIMSSYNPPFYNEHVTAFGLEKIKDLWVYNCDLGQGYQMPERFFKFNQAIQQRYQVDIRPIRMDKLVEEARIIVRLANLSTSDNWGFCPVSESESVAIAADLKLIVHPEAVLIAEIKGEPIGYLVSLPDVNCLLTNRKGRLWPTGIFKLLFGLKKINRYRIWALGIVPKYQKKGITILLFSKLNEAVTLRKPYIEANYVLEDNHLMNNALRRLEFNLVKKYRIYEKALDMNVNCK